MLQPPWPLSPGIGPTSVKRFLPLLTLAAEASHGAESAAPQPLSPPLIGHDVRRAVAFCVRGRLHDTPLGNFEGGLGLAF